jgi:hypothetical protein
LEAGGRCQPIATERGEDREAGAEQRIPHCGHADDQNEEQQGGIPAEVAGEPASLRGQVGLENVEPVQPWHRQDVEHEREHLHQSQERQPGGKPPGSLLVPTTAVRAAPSARLVSGPASDTADATALERSAARLIHTAPPGSGIPPIASSASGSSSDITGSL